MATNSELRDADYDYRNWRKMVDWELAKRPGKPGLCEYHDEAIRYSYAERCDTPAQAAAWLNV